MADDGGISRVKRRLNAIPKDVREALAPDLMKSGHELASLMKQLAPEKSGDLKDSIAVTGPGRSTPPYSTPGGESIVPDNAVAVTVGNSDVRYPHLVEYGHKASGFSQVDVPAHPFFWPALRLLRKRLTNRMKRTASKAVKKHWGK